MAIFLFGYGFIVYLACILGYHLTYVNHMVIALIAYGISQTVLRNAKILRISLLISILLLGISGFWVYQNGRMDYVLQELLEFVEPYYLSLNQQSTIAIDVFHQGVLMTLIAVVAYKLVYQFRNHSFTYILIFIASLGLSIGGFFLKRLEGPQDQPTFILYSCFTIILFFYYFYMKNKHRAKEKGFMPYLTVSAVFAAAVVGLSFGFYKAFPEPLEIQKSVPKPGEYQQIVNQENEKKQQEVELSAGGKIENKFQHKNIELFQVKTTGVGYLKGLVFENYNRGQWEMAKTDEGMYKEMPKDTALPATKIVEVSVNYTTMKSDSLFVTDDILLMQTQNINSNVIFDDDRGTYHLGAAESGITYQFQTMYGDNLNHDYINLLKSNSGNFPIPVEDSAYTLPDGYSDIKKLAQEITNGLDNEYDKIQAIIDYLDKNYTYKTDPVVSEDPDMDPIRYFLFTSKEGFCQHFASAAALMLRSIDIPTRYVIGFKVDNEYTYNPADMANNRYEQMQDQPIGPGYRIVRDTDAHSWVEVYFPETGWEIFEATPGFGSIALNLESSVQEETKVAKATTSSSPISIQVVIGIGVLLAIGALVMGIVKLYMRKSRFKKDLSTNKVRAYHRLMLDYLSVLKLDKEHFETAREHALRVDKENEKTMVSMSQIIPIYERVVYGNYDVDEMELGLFVGCLKSIKKTAYKKMGLFRCLRVYFKEFLVTG